VVSRHPAPGRPGAPLHPARCVGSLCRPTPPMAGAAATMRAACVAPAARVAASGRAPRRGAGAVAEVSSDGSGPSRAVRRVQQGGTARLGGRRRAAATAAAALAEGAAAAPVGAAVHDSPYGVEVRARPPCPRQSPSSSPASARASQSDQQPAGCAQSTSHTANRTRVANKLRRVYPSELLLHTVGPGRRCLPLHRWSLM